MRAMAKKKPQEPTKRGPGRPTGRTRVPVSLRLPESLVKALEVLIERTRRPTTTEIEIALENHLKEAGLWPPPEGEPVED